MLYVQIEQSLEVNGHLFEVLAGAQKQANVDAADEYLMQHLAYSSIYQVERETPETIAVFMVHGDGAVARVGAE